ncbi:MAG: AzlC family ABC transporter permease [Clostridia bacterium]|nr:AzlC family ABC transporter permease [Clostridia bacterium]
MQTSRWRPALKAAFPHTIPIMTGFLFLGMAYGILMRTQGFHPLFPTVMAMTIFGGSLEYVCVEMLLSAFAPVETLLMALLIQARHLFYGIAMLDKYRGFGWKTPLLIFGMCDESFSINCSVEVPKDIDKGWFYLWVTILNWSYWWMGATLGAQLGAVLPFDTEGLDFVMTAMLFVIFLDAWLKEKQHWSSLIGLGCAVGCLLIFGAEGFMLPTMGCILAALYLARKPIEAIEGRAVK